MATKTELEQSLLDAYRQIGYLEAQVDAAKQPAVNDPKMMPVSDFVNAVENLDRGTVLPFMKLIRNRMGLPLTDAKALTDRILQRHKGVSA